MATLTDPTAQARQRSCLSRIQPQLPSLNPFELAHSTLSTSASLKSQRYTMNLGTLGGLGKEVAGGCLWA